MLFYLTILNLVRLLIENAPSINEGETDMLVINAVEGMDVL